MERKNMYLIKNGTVHTGTGKVLEEHDILVEGTKIRKIGKNLCEEDAEVIDATGKQVFPGFIDPHSSIGAMGIPTRYRDNAETTNVINPDLSVKYAIDPDEVNAQEFYKSGITSVGFSPDHSNVIGGQITVCKTAPDHMANRIVKEHAAMKGSVCSTVKDVYGASNQMPKTRMGIFHLLKEAIRKDDLLKKYQMPFVIAAETAGEIQCLMELLKDEDIQLTIVDGFEFGDAIEELKEKEQNNLDQKTVICEIVEGMEYDTFTTFADWEDKTNEILALQAKWKTIGYAPQKMNVKIFERFRAACDEFFRRKAAFFKSVKETMAANLEKKKAFCEKAEALKESTDWKETAEILTKLQKEWKTIGPVAKKHSDAVWKRFIGACDYFFERKNKATSSQRSEEVENLAKKEDVIKRMTALEAAGTADDATAEQVRALMKEWNAIGFVPFKEKDRLYKEFHALVDKLFDRLHLSATEKRLSSVRTNGNKEGNLYRDRERLVRTYEGLKNDIQTYENNLGFLNSSSKKGNTLVADITRKIERLKKDMELVLKKIKDIDESLKEKE